MVIRYLPSGALDRGFGSGGSSAGTRGPRRHRGRRVQDWRKAASWSRAASTLASSTPSCGRTATGSTLWWRRRSCHRRDCAPRLSDACRSYRADRDAGWRPRASRQRSDSSGVFRFDAAGHWLHRFGADGLVRLRRMSYFGAASDVTLTSAGRILVVGGTEFAGAAFASSRTATATRASAVEALWSCAAASNSARACLSGWPHTPRRALPRRGRPQPGSGADFPSIRPAFS